MQNFTKLKKIRGHNRIRKKIELWRNVSLKPNLDLIQNYYYDYVKIWISPFSNLNYKENDYSGPKSGNRLLILNALFDIYDNWDLELKKLNTAYYLKIWLYEPRFTRSQVVCAIEDRIEWYDEVLQMAENNIKFPHDKYKKLANRIDQFTWTAAIDDEIFENEFQPKEQYPNDSDLLQHKRVCFRYHTKDHKYNRYHPYDLLQAGYGANESSIY